MSAIFGFSLVPSGTVCKPIILRLCHRTSFHILLWNKWSSWNISLEKCRSSNRHWQSFLKQKWNFKHITKHHLIYALLTFYYVFTEIFYPFLLHLLLLKALQQIWTCGSFDCTWCGRLQFIYNGEIPYYEFNFLIVHAYLNMIHNLSSVGIFLFLFLPMMWLSQTMLPY